MDLNSELSYLMSRELQLICLFKNAKDAVIDLIDYFHSNEHIALNDKDILQKLKTSVLAIFPKYIAKDPSSLEEMRNNLKVFIASNPCDDLDVFNSVERFLLLGIFIGNANEDIYDMISMGLLNDKDFPRVKSWNEFWKFNCGFVIKMLSYLNNKGALDDRRYFQRCLEIESVLLEESKEFMYKIYAGEIRYHYNIERSLPMEDKYVRRWKHVLRFDIQFSIDNLESKAASCVNYWFSSKKRFSFRDMGLDSDMSKKLCYSVQNIFRDRLGDENNGRYSVCMYCVDIESIKIPGKQESESSLYEIIISPPAGTYIHDYYDDCMSPESSAFLDQLKNTFKSTILQNMGKKVNVGLNSWVFGPNIKSSGFILKKNESKKWTLDELYEMDKSIDEAIIKFNREFEDLKITSMRSFYRKATGNLNYCFQVRVHSVGLLETIKDIISYAQRIIMEIDEY